jgi:uncharacterized membrane protein
MAISKEKLHKFFEAGVIVKGIDSVAEITLGILFFALSSGTVNKVISFIFGDELTEQPRDLIWQILLHNFNGLSASSQFFWAIIFVAHGIAKIILLVGLIKKRLWIYLFSVVVFSSFVIYQAYHIIFSSPSIVLGLLTVIDAAFTVLIVFEYRYQRSMKDPRSV